MKLQTTTGDLLTFLTILAKEYRPDSVNSIRRNAHMNDVNEGEVPQQVVDATLVDFINYIGVRNCVDYGLYTKDIF